MPRSPTLILALLLALAAGCGGGDDEAEGGGGGDSAPASTATAAAASPQAGGGAQFSDLLALYESAEYRISYEMSTTAGGQSFDGKMTWYRAADGRFRVDFEASQGGQTIESTTIVTPEDSYFCTDVAGQQSCLKFGAGSTLPFPDLSAPVVSQVEAITALGTFGATSSRTIAGVEATCVTFDEGGVSGTTCISDGGVLLLIETSSAAGTTRLEAIDFESGVSDDDFEPPYTVTSFPG